MSSVMRFAAVVCRRRCASRQLLARRGLPPEIDLVFAEFDGVSSEGRWRGGELEMSAKS